MSHISQMNNHRFACFIACIALVFFSCNHTEKEKTPNTETTVNANEVSLPKSRLELLDIRLGKVEGKELGEQINAPGKVVILSQYQAGITAKVSGTIEEIYVLEGQKISKGQALMKLASSMFVELQEAYLSAKSESQYLSADYERQKGLRKENVIGEKEFQLLQSKHEAALAKVRAAEARLRILGVAYDKLSANNSIDPYYIIRSPINGYLYQLPVSLGMSVVPVTELAHVMNMDKYHADAYVFEKDIDFVQVGQDVDVRFANASLAPVKGKVEFIAPGMDPVKRSIVIHITFDPPKGVVLPDMTLTATFHSTAKQAITIPASAIVRSDNETFVYQLVNEPNAETLLFARKNVKLIREEGTLAELAKDSGIDEQAMIVVKGAMLLEGELKREEE